MVADDVMTTASESETKSSRLSNGLASSVGQNASTVEQIRAAKERGQAELMELRRRVNELESALDLPITVFVPPPKVRRDLGPRPELHDTKLTFEEPKRPGPPMPRRHARAVARAAKQAGSAPKSRGPRPGSMVEKALAFLKAHPDTKTDILARKFGVTRVRAAGLYGQLEKMGLAKSEGSRGDMTWRAT